MLKLKAWCLGALLCGSLSVAHAEALKPLKVGVLKYGTVNWVLDTVKKHDLAKKHGVDLQVTGLSGKDSSHVALQGGAVDVIVSDWLWVSRLRSEGSSYTFSPYSIATGSLMVNPAVGAKSLADLKGKALGIAGGSVDKTWLLMQAYAAKTQQGDLKDWVDTKFGAPPLLNELAKKGDLDAVINFWHFAAKLKAAGFVPLVDTPTVLKELGIERPLPLIGWVFDETFAAENEEAIKGFLAATREAQALLVKDDEVWQGLRKRMKAEGEANEPVFIALRDAFREGVPTCFGKEEVDASEKAFALLAELGGKKLVGDATALAADTFWSGTALPACSKAQ